MQLPTQTALVLAAQAGDQTAFDTGVCGAREQKSGLGKSGHKRK